MLLLTFLLLFQEDVYKVTVGKPVLYEKDNNPNTYISGIRQLESNGEHLFILSDANPLAVQIKSDGTLVRKIGGKGQGPGELGYHGPISMAVEGQSAWIYRSDMRGLQFYDQGNFVTSIKIKGYQPGHGATPAYSFGFEQNRLLIQTHPRNRSLAMVYDYEGNLLQEVGKILPVEPEFLEVNPALNNTSWVRDGKSWWCLFIYRPILREYDSDFKLLREIILHGPEIEEKEEIFLENKIDPRWRPYPKWHFSDFKVFRNSIYILCEGVLYQVDKRSGVLKSRTVFFSNKKMLAVFDFPRVSFQYLAFLDSGKVYLASSIFAFDYNGLWEADLPFLLNE
jgi:hypothetical protein